VQARYEASRYSRDRSYLPGLTADAIQDITSGDRLELMRRARYFEKNSPLAQQILDLIEQNVVGTGINPTPASSNPEYNKRALAAWNTWCQYADNTSRQHFYTLQAIIARAQAVDGEIFAWLTEGETGRPRIQLFEAHRVTGQVKLPAEYENLINVDGILIDQRGRPQFYCVNNEINAPSAIRAGSVTILPASEFVHFFEPSRAGQYRGVSLFHAALITLHDLDDLQRYEMLAAKDSASRSTVIKTESGEYPDAGPVIGRSMKVKNDDGSEESRTAYYRQALGAETIILKRGDDLQQTEALRPSPVMRDFWEYLTEQVCRAVGISFAAVKNYNGWGGAALRGAITSDNRFYEVRTNVLTAGFQRIWEHVIGYANDRGENGEVPADWAKVRWQPPRRSTVDIGRESAALLNELRIGIRTERDILGETGQDSDEVRNRRADEIDAWMDRAQAMATKRGIPLMTAYSILVAPPGNVAMPPAPAEPAPQNVTAVLAHDPVVAFLTSAAPLDVPCEVATALPTSFVWMPAGSHAISAGSLSGEGWKGKVVCDEKGAEAVARDFNKSITAGRRLWIDFNHEDAEAAAWVNGFSWDAARGIICNVEWTKDGEEALREKAYYSFSPAFLVDRESGRVAGLIFGHAAGGLVNAPAFGAAMPALIAARLGGADLTNPVAGGIPVSIQQPHTMSDEIKTDTVAATAAAVENVEVKNLRSELEALKASQKVAADEFAAIKAAKPKEQAAPVIVAPSVDEVKAAHGSATAKPNAFEAIKAMMKEKDSRKRGQIYCSELRSFVAEARNLAEVLAANSFGSVTSDLIVLRCLDLLKFKYPILSMISTDFSDGAVPLQGQNIVSRIVSVPPVVTYNTTTGWASSDATTTDVPVVIGAPVGVQISLQNTEIGGSNRDLFAEQVEASHTALGKNMVDALYAIITQANFSGAPKRTIKALASFARGDVIDMGTALSKRGVGDSRFLLLNSDYYGALTKDLVTVANPALIGGNTLQTRALPRVQDFNVIEAATLPANAFTSTTGTLQGFGGGKDSLVIATRVPDDYTKALPGSSHGSVSVVTNPDTGISVQKVDFVDHVLGRAYSRIAISYGVAKGQVASGQCLTET